mmetsp:Transcript_35696/g.90036  ORF Transcript_35696/g.90036 Transcript_35696/m.90036 type:complete len:339 (+) Transcript_35696:777-1793(+)
MTSSPLFISVALSTVIFFPMDQLGCLIASSTRTSFSVSTGRSRNAPPLAVRMIRRRPSSGRPWMHWNSALCSLSAGRILTPYSSASGSTYGPPAMSVSLLARQMSLPCLMAATVGCSPAQPTMPVTTACASGCTDTSTTPAMPVTISGIGLCPASSSFSSASLDSSWMHTRLGLNLRVCSASSLALDPAASAHTAKRSGCSSTMSRVCVPMEPVEPMSEKVLSPLGVISGGTQRPGQAGGTTGVPLEAPTCTARSRPPPGRLLLGATRLSCLPCRPPQRAVSLLLVDAVLLATDGRRAATIRPAHELAISVTDCPPLCKQNNTSSVERWARRRHCCDC